MSQDQSPARESPGPALDTLPGPERPRAARPRTPRELHEYGIAATAHEMRNGGFQKVRCNYKMGTFPQIFAEREGRRMCFIVKTAVFPDEPWIESAEEKDFHLTHSRRLGIPCYFASVRIVPAAPAHGDAAAGAASDEFTYVIQIYDLEKVVPWDEHLRQTEARSRSTQVKPKVDSLN